MTVFQAETKMVEMPSPPPRSFLFEDAVICGMLGGAIAWLLGESFVVSAMLCAVAGPIFMIVAHKALAALPVSLPGKEARVYEFLLFAICVALAVPYLRSVN